jgi:hypothetical protein
MKNQILILSSILVVNFLVCIALPSGEEALAVDGYLGGDAEVQAVGIERKSREIDATIKNDLSGETKTGNLIAEQETNQHEDTEVAEEFKKGGSSAIKPVRPRPPVIIPGRGSGGSRNGSSNNLIALSITKLLVIATVIYKLH